MTPQLFAKQKKSDGKTVPVAMIFIPCKNGVSHAKEEFRDNQRHKERRRGAGQHYLSAGEIRTDQAELARDVQKKRGRLPHGSRPLHLPCGIACKILKAEVFSNNENLHIRHRRFLVHYRRDIADAGRKLTVHALPALNTGILAVEPFHIYGAA